jgi:NAD(P)-dependent dehydrogenase (short-subunit alcohol dehydrogenase family)
MTTTYLVTGASRGLGAEFVRQLRAVDHQVIAAVRNPEKARDAAAAGARVLPLDVDRPETFAGFAARLDGPIDVLINNAGIAERDASIESLEPQIWERVFRTNVFGQALLSEALLPALRRGRRRTIANVSSGLGSLGLAMGGFSYAYCCSKAALNMLTVLMHKELANDGFTVVSLDPGWNRTDMGGGEAPLDPRDTVAGMVKLLERLQPSQAGTFVGWDGEARPW